MTKNNKIVIGIIGEIGSGKGAAARYFHEKYGSENFRFSTMLRDIMRRLHLPETRENMQTVSTMLRQTFGEDLLARVIFDDVTESSAELIVTEGIRRPSDIDYLSRIVFDWLLFNVPPKTNAPAASVTAPTPAPAPAAPAAK